MTTTPEQMRAWRERQREGLGAARVYRLFDAADRLLYIGCTTLPVAERMRLHRRKRLATGRRLWLNDVARIEVDEYATVDDARAAEAEAIRRLEPPGNIAGTVHGYMMLRDHRAGAA